MNEIGAKENKPDENISGFENSNLPRT